jgi:hypothetical protein
MKTKSLLKVMGDEKERMAESLLHHNPMMAQTHERRGDTPNHRTRRFGHNK